MTAKPPEWVGQARHKWTNTGAVRPPFALEPQLGQESVWSYPRPPAVVSDRRLVEARVGSTTIAHTTDAVRVLETASPPAFYLPPGDVDADRLEIVAGRSHCEWKGDAEYLAVIGAVEPIAWRYPDPYPDFTDLAGLISFYPGRVHCTVDGETVRPQPGRFYGGWITDEIVGPYKGEPGTEGW